MFNKSKKWEIHKFKAVFAISQSGIFSFLGTGAKTFVQLEFTKEHNMKLKLLILSCVLLLNLNAFSSTDDVFEKELSKIINVQSELFEPHSDSGLYFNLS